MLKVDACTYGQSSNMPGIMISSRTSGTSEISKVLHMSPPETESVGAAWIFTGLKCRGFPLDHRNVARLSFTGQVEFCISNMRPK